MKIFKSISKFFQVNKPKRIDTNQPYEKIIETLIRNDEMFISTSVKDLKWEGNSNFYQDKLDQIISLAKDRNFVEIKKQFSLRPKTFDDLSYFSFSDDTDKSYVAIIYDSDELSQDPQILEILE